MSSENYEESDYVLNLDWLIVSYKACTWFLKEKYRKNSEHLYSSTLLHPRLLLRTTENIQGNLWRANLCIWINLSTNSEIPRQPKFPNFSVFIILELFQVAPPRLRPLKLFVSIMCAMALLFFVSKRESERKRASLPNDW